MPVPCPVPAPLPLLRVLIAGASGAGNDSLAAWLAERENLVVEQPAGTTAAALARAADFKPHAVLLDLHGASVPAICLIRLFKEVSPSSLVCVLTHEASVALRRRCREAGADAVFDKTTELEAVAALLRQSQLALS